MSRRFLIWDVTLALTFCCIAGYAVSVNGLPGSKTSLANQLNRWNDAFADMGDISGIPHDDVKRAVKAADALIRIDPHCKLGYDSKIHYLSILGAKGEAVEVRRQEALGGLSTGEADSTLAAFGRTRP